VDRHCLDIPTSDFLTAGLLNDMGEFVGEKFLAGSGPQTRRVTQENIGTNGEGPGLETIVEISHLRSRVQSDVRQIRPESCAHLRSHIVWERFAAPAASLNSLLGIGVDCATRMTYDSLP
jgi:hypothetical protein